MKWGSGEECRDGKPIMLEKGQLIIVEAVGAAYTEFQGYKEEGGETRIGVSYDKLCETMSPGLTILIADGTICIRVRRPPSPRLPSPAPARLPIRHRQRLRMQKFPTGKQDSKCSKWKAGFTKKFPKD